MIDVLAFGAHPDDCEMFAGGTLLSLKAGSYRTGICDLSMGESGTFGTAEIRRKEAEASSRILSLDFRETLDFPDGSIRSSEEGRLKIIDVIRRTQPELVFSFADGPLRHPDHIHCGRMVKECCYLAGLEKITTGHPPHRPSQYIGFPELFLMEKPDFIIDISDFWEKKLAAIRCFGTQVVDSRRESEGINTLIHSEQFWEVMEARSRMAGAMIGVRYGEPFYSQLPPRINDPVQSFFKEIK